MFRHGDLAFTQIDKLPDCQFIDEVESFTLALGEATGHHHLLTTERPKTKFRIYKDKDGNNILELKEKAVLTHEEHKEITFMPGIYIQKHEREYDYPLEQIKQVAD
jgi:hypothetical protein